MKSIYFESSVSLDLPLIIRCGSVIRMNSVVFVAVVALASFAAAETYTDRYDNINVEEILENRKLLVPYVKCTLEQGRCTPEGKELKTHIKDAMQNGCSKCTDKQKIGARKVVKHLKEKEPEFYKQLISKYDPEDQYKETYEAFLAAEN
ncbi:allergen Tha p 1-like [Anticarsia gemmatalis]|uniref:allergen Tha p 1-like n=1 Tax=Anticarsia gemmatalis TaxID=129554 RepID=UPI003F75C1DA